MIEISFETKLIPYASAVITKWRNYNPRSSEKRFTQWKIRSLQKNQRIDGFVVVEFIFKFKIPSSFSKKKRQMIFDGLLYPTDKDCTNLQKFYEDCIKNILIEDDRKVVKIISEKLYDENESVTIRIYSVGEYEDLYRRSGRI